MLDVVRDGGDVVVAKRHPAALAPVGVRDGAGGAQLVPDAEGIGQIAGVHDVEIGGPVVDRCNLCHRTPFLLFPAFAPHPSAAPLRHPHRDCAPQPQVTRRAATRGERSVRATADRRRAADTDRSTTMETTPYDEPALTTAHLPQPRGQHRWRWSDPGPGRGGRRRHGRRARPGCRGGGGGEHAVVDAGTPPNRPPPPGSTASPKSGTHRLRASPGGHSSRAGSLRSCDTAITVRARATETTTVEYSADTTFTSLGAKGASTTASASALKVGVFVGVQGTAHRATARYPPRASC